MLVDRLVVKMVCGLVVLMACYTAVMMVGVWVFPSAVD